LKVLHDTETELSDKTREYKQRQTHHRACAQINERRVMEMQSEICELTSLVSSLRMDNNVPDVPVVADVIMPVGYASSNFTCMVSHVRYPVVTGIHGAYYTLRSATVVKRMDASQVARMIAT
jgi:hypothetical protein